MDLVQIIADTKKALSSNTMLRYIAADMLFIEPHSRKTAVGCRAPYFTNTPERRATQAAIESSRQSA